MADTNARLTAATLVLLLMSATAGQLGVPDWLHLVLNVGVYLTGGWVAVREAVPKLLRGVLDVDFLMVFAAAGAAAIGQLA